MERIVVAFAGNPNVEKTALINAISGFSKWQPVAALVLVSAFCEFPVLSP